MKYDEIMKLLDAGFNRDEILLMMNHDIENPNESVDDEETDINEKTDNDISAISEALEEVKNTVAEFKKEFTAMNIMNSRIENPEQSADEILANVINPFESK